MFYSAVVLGPVAATFAILLTIGQIGRSTVEDRASLRVAIVAGSIALAAGLLGIALANLLDRHHFRDESLGREHDWYSVMIICGLTAPLGLIAGAVQLVAFVWYLLPWGAIILATCLAAAGAAYGWSLGRVKGWWNAEPG
jgi:hypothetical protein